MTEYEQLSFDWFNTYEEVAKSIKPVGEFKLKKCSKCKEFKEATTEYFPKHSHTKSKLNSWCRKCNSTNSAIFRTKRENLCIYCNNDKLPQTNVCAYHLVYHMIKSQYHCGRFKNLKTTELKKEFALSLIEKIKSQDYKCSITGESLVLGVNASIDHIKDISQGGTCELDNLQWVTKTANARKPRKIKEGR